MLGCNRASTWRGVPLQFSLCMCPPSCCPKGRFLSIFDIFFKKKTLLQTSRNSLYVQRVGGVRSPLPPPCFDSGGLKPKTPWEGAEQQQGCSSAPAGVLPVLFFSSTAALAAVDDARQHWIFKILNWTNAKWAQQVDPEQKEYYYVLLKCLCAFYL